MVLVVIASYLLGAFPTAVLVGQRQGRDPTVEGSGNPGASNVYRLMGRWPAVLVLLGDAGKGVAAAAIGQGVGGRAGLFACGLAAVLGHCFPVIRRRKVGGRGVATAGGVAIVAVPLLAALALAGWIVVALATRKASLASIVAMVMVPASAAVRGRPAAEVAALAAIAAVVIARHGENIGRLLTGQERSLK